MDNPGYVVYTDEIELKEQSRTDSNPKISTQQPQTDTSKFSSSTSNQNDSQAAAASNESSATSSSAVCNDCGESTGPVRKREPRLIYCRDGVITEDEVGKLFDEFDEPLSKVGSVYVDCEKNNGEIAQEIEMFFKKTFNCTEYRSVYMRLSENAVRGIVSFVRWVKGILVLSSDTLRYTNYKCFYASTLMKEKILIRRKLITPLFSNYLKAR